MGWRKRDGKVQLYRWCILVKFGDQTEVILRDFYCHHDAVEFAQTLSGRDLYPGRVYSVSIEERLFEVDNE